MPWLLVPNLNVSRRAYNYCQARLYQLSVGNKFRSKLFDLFDNCLIASELAIDNLSKLTDSIISMSESLIRRRSSLK